MAETDEEVIARVIEDLSAPPEKAQFKMNEATQEVHDVLHKRFLHKKVTPGLLDEMQAFVDQMLAVLPELGITTKILVSQDREDPTRVLFTFY